MNHPVINVLEAKKSYLRGENVVQYLKEKYGDLVALSEIIEVAYDLQAGTYIEGTQANLEKVSKFWHEAASIIDKYSLEHTNLLDVGTGEMTTLSGVVSLLKKQPNEIFAFDISWSRLFKGHGYVSEYYPSLLEALNPFCADMNLIPLPTNSIDLVISNHSLEPNGDQQLSLLAELFRVATKRLMLFEPCYEINTEEGKARMDSHGYIKGLDETIKTLGGKLVDKIKIKNIANPLNPTVCFIIDVTHNTPKNSPALTAPGTDFPLVRDGGFFVSRKSGQSFPIFKGIPVLRAKNAVISTALCD